MLTCFFNFFSLPTEKEKMDAMKRAIWDDPLCRLPESSLDLAT
jgi:hypothetical protein